METSAYQTKQLARNDWAPSCLTSFTHDSRERTLVQCETDKMAGKGRMVTVVLSAIFPNGASFSSIKLVMQPLQLPNAKHSQIERCVYFH